MTLSAGPIRDERRMRPTSASAWPKDAVARRLFFKHGTHEWKKWMNLGTPVGSGNLIVHFLRAKGKKPFACKLMMIGVTSFPGQFIVVSGDTLWSNSAPTYL